MGMERGEGRYTPRPRAAPVTTIVRDISEIIGMWVCWVYEKVMLLGLISIR